MRQGLIDMHLGETQIWDGPQGHPVEVRREEDPDGPYWTVLSEGAELVFSDPDLLLTWLEGA